MAILPPEEIVLAIKPGNDASRIASGLPRNNFQFDGVPMSGSDALPRTARNSLTWSMVDWEVGMWVLNEREGRRTSRVPKPRVIRMNEEVKQVLLRRRGQFGGSGHVFLNADGGPWTKDTLRHLMRHLRERAGIKVDEQGEQFVLYTNRHTFLTAAGADSALSPSRVAGMAGHTNPATTEKYIHAARLSIADDGRRLAGRLKPQAPASGD